MNKTEKPEAEWVEGRTLTKRNSQHDAGARAQNRSSTTSRLLAVRKAAKRDKARQLRIPAHDGHLSDLMAVRIPGAWRSGFRRHGGQFAALTGMLTAMAGIGL